MASEKVNVNVQIDADVNEMASRLLAGLGIEQVSPESALPLDEQLSVLIRKRSPLAVRLECDQTGTLSIDKDKHPDIYEWLVNG